MLKSIKLMSKFLPGDWYRHHLVFKNDLWSGGSLTRRRILRICSLPVEIWMLVNARLRGKIVLPRVEMVLTTRCNLRCKECGNLIPYFPDQTDYDVHHIIDDLYNLLEVCGRIYRLILIGGETFMYKPLTSILKKLKEEKRIDLIHVITNGTILPDKELLDELSHKKVIVSVSLIPEEISAGRTSVINTLRASGVKLIRFEMKEWRQLGTPGRAVFMPNGSIENKFSNCRNKVCHSIFEGSFYICPRSYALEKMGLFAQDRQESVSLRNRTDFGNIRDEIEDLRKKNYLAACTFCNGEAGGTVEPYEQLPEHYSNPTRQLLPHHHNAFDGTQ